MTERKKRELNETETDAMEQEPDPANLNYFEHPTKSNDQASIWINFLKSTTCYTKCKLCGRHSKVYGASSTAGMLSHLQSYHKEEYDRLKDAQEVAKKPKQKPSTVKNTQNLTSQNNQTSFSSNQRHTARPNASSSSIVSEQDLHQFLSFDYDNIIFEPQSNPGNVALEPVLAESQQREQPRKNCFGAEDKSTGSTNETVPVGTLLKLEQLNHNINTLLKLNSVSKEPNYNFVISLLEMLRCIKNENDLTDLKAKIYKLIADTIATQQ